MVERFLELKPALLEMMNLEEYKAHHKVLKLVKERDWTTIREAPLKFMQQAFGHCPNSFCTAPRTQPGTLGHFISEKVPQTIRAGVQTPPQSSKFFPKKLPQTIRVKR